ncbi:helix-turn-helix domain-containing protein [bacterium]|nr:helix-turn-helix domain-containing protein [bacterium]
MVNRENQIKALSNANRLEILRLLMDPAKHFRKQKSADPGNFGVCIQLIAEKINVAQPTVSRHIDILKRAGFVSIQRHQQWSYCSRDEHSLSNFHQWLQTELGIE